MPTPDLNFEVVATEIPDSAAQPLLSFKLHVTCTDEQIPIQSVILRSQIALAVTRRRYTRQERERLRDIFGEPERWSETLHDRLWTHASTVIPPFSGHTTVDLLVPCTYDFEVANTRYFDALEAGDIPLDFLFSGTIFYADKQDNLQAGQISWQKEAHYRLAVATWREMIQRYYPNSVWLHLPKDVFDQLSHYKVSRGLPTWEEALVQLLERDKKEACL